MSKAQRLAARLARDNPQAEVRNGRGHYVILVDGKIVGILPYVQAKEGLSANLRRQLERAGLSVPS